MMETSVIGAGTTVSSAQATTRGFSDLSSENFFQLLIAELQSQDPLKPTDNQQLLQQLSTIRSMEQTVTLNKTLQTLAAEQRFGSTASLIGHYVSGTVTNSGGQAYELRGLVIGVRFEGNGEAILELHNGRSLPAAKVEQVTLVENLPSDILAELEAELGRSLSASGEGGEEEDDEESSGSSAAKAVAGQKSKLGSSEPAATGSAGDHVRAFTQRADTTAGYLDALLAPWIVLGF